MVEYIYSYDLFKSLCGITNHKYTLMLCDSSIADEMVVKYHYSHKATQNRFASFLVNQDKGVLQLGYGIRPSIKHSISNLITRNNYCEFDRMWLSDELPKFAESQVISLLLKFIKAKWNNIKFLITYADSSVGNTGIIYRATNAIYIGGHKTDFYLLETGERVHPVSMYHRHKTRKFSVLKEIYPNIQHITSGIQHRYLYILDKRLLKKYKENKCQ